ncbi:MAG: N-6 DNA methylase [Pirellulaceae bacterium]|nr:N-6 DNA methylase [Pirellulaceae bacterium]
MDEANPRTIQQRRSAGAFFTPQAVVRYLVRHTLEPLVGSHRGDRPLRILEPACGDGGILAEAFRCLRQRRLQECVQQAAAEGSFDPAHLLRDAEGNWQLGDGEQRRLLLSSCFGLDINPEFVAATRRRLAGSAAAGDPARRRSLESVLRTNIRCGDALLGPDFELPPDAGGGDRPVDWQRDFAGIWQASGGGFDAVIGNPPYVNIRRLTLSRSAAVKRYLRTHYQCARGAYDLYVLFLELAFRVLRPGGLCGLIVPNKLAGLTYAGPCRALLSEQTTIRRIVDLSQWRVFPDAGVYPYIVIWQKQPPEAEHRIAVLQAASEAELAADRGEWCVRQSALSAADGWHLHGTLDVESRVSTRPLRTLARLHSGTTGFQAAALASELAGEPTGGVSTRRDEYFRFVVSGNVDRYRICWGRARFMKRTLIQPVLARESPVLSDGKRRLFCGPKIVIAGMTRRIEAAWDPGGLALGVQVFAAADLQEDRWYLLGLLNSKLLSYLFRGRFRAKQLSGGFLAINKTQLDQLPIRIVPAEDRTAVQIRQQVVRCVQRLERLTNDAADTAAPTGKVGARILALERQIDACVYRLYQLTSAEVERVEAEFSSMP